MSNFLKGDFFEGINTDAIDLAISSAENKEGELLQGTEEWHKKRLGRITASRFSEIGFTEDKEVRCESKNPTKDDKISWINGQGKRHLLQDIAPMGDVSKLKLEQINPIYDGLPGIIVPGGLTKGAETYMQEIIATNITGCWKEFKSIPTDWGNLYEEYAIQHYEGVYGVETQKTGFVLWDKNQLVGGSPDRLVGTEGIIEVKCPFNSAVHVNTLLSGEMPTEHSPQVQGYLWITGRQWCDFISFDPRVKKESMKMFCVRVERNEEYIAKLERDVTRFAGILEARMDKLGKMYGA